MQQLETLENRVRFRLMTNHPKVGSSEMPYYYDNVEAARKTVEFIRDHGYSARICAEHTIITLTEVF